jgi:hypothetical protein
MRPIGRFWLQVDSTAREGICESAVDSSSRMLAVKGQPADIVGPFPLRMH